MMLDSVGLALQRLLLDVPRVPLASQLLLIGLVVLWFPVTMMTMMSELFSLLSLFFSLFGT
jgi:hypothetical protein